MGGLMSYQRMRARNQIRERPEGSGPYGGPVPPALHPYTLVGDMNRMERDYVGDTAMTEGVRDKDRLARDVAEAVGLTVEQVQAVLRYVFFEQQ